MDDEGATSAGTAAKPVREFALRVRELRKARHLTQEALAARVSEYGAPMRQTTLAKIENAARPTTVNEIWALAAALECDFAHLLPAPPSHGEGELEGELAEAVRGVELAELLVELRKREHEAAAAALGEALVELQRAEAARNTASTRFLEAKARE